MVIEGVQPWVILSVSSILFFIGLLGLMIRKNIIILLMCIELLLNAVNMAFIAFSKINTDIGGEISVFFVIVVAAAESAVGLGLVIAMFRTLRSVNTDDLKTLKE